MTTGAAQVAMSHALMLHKFAVETERAMLLLEIRVTDLWNTRAVES